MARASWKNVGLCNRTKINPHLPKIQVGPPIIQLRQDVIKDLSTDQYYGYMIVDAIKSGNMPDNLALLKIEPVSYSRWLTTALRFCRMWVFKHGLKGKLLSNPRLIVEFLVAVCIPCWFNIKVKHSWIEGPYHILFQLGSLRNQKNKVLDIVLPTVRRSAYYAHPESVLQALICSDNYLERNFGVDKILEI